MKKGIENYEIRHGFKNPSNFIDLLPKKFTQRSDLFYAANYNQENFKDIYGIKKDLENPLDRVLDFLSDRPDYNEFSPVLILSGGIS